MARLVGSDDLFRLIHSLTPEEKGYYKKLAKRHTARGTNYVKLFDAINDQEVFEEKSLKQEFKHYAVMKVYLKDMITDSLMIYHKFNHPHIELLNEIQRIHIFLIKGMVDEAIKVLKKALITARKMEVFAIERYLIRIYSEISQQHLSGGKSIHEFFEQYKASTEQNLKLESDLTQWELLNAELFAGVKNKKVAGETTNTVNAKTALSKRSEIKKLNCLFQANEITGNNADNYDITKKQVELSFEYKKKGDAAYNNVYLQCNHILTCIALGRYDEALGLCEKMVTTEKRQHFYSDLAFIKSTVFKLTVYYHQRRFDEAIELIKGTEAEVISISNRLGDDVTLYQFFYHKLIFNLIKKNYQECWMDLQTIDDKEILKDSVEDFADFEILQLIIQYEMGNNATLKNLLKNDLRKFKKQGIGGEQYELILGFFKKVKPANITRLAQDTLAQLDSYYATGKAAPYKLFKLLPYTDILKAYRDSKPLAEVLN